MKTLIKSEIVPTRSRLGSVKSNIRPAPISENLESKESLKPEFCNISKSVTPVKSPGLDSLDLSTAEKQEILRKEKKQKKVLEMYKIASETRNKLLEVPIAPEKRPKHKNMRKKPALSQDVLNDQIIQNQEKLFEPDAEEINKSSKDLSDVSGDKVFSTDGQEKLTNLVSTEKPEIFFKSEETTIKNGSNHSKIFDQSDNPMTKNFTLNDGNEVLDSLAASDIVDMTLSEPISSLLEKEQEVLSQGTGQVESEYQQIHCLFANIEVDDSEKLYNVAASTHKIRPEALKKIESRLNKADLHQV